MGSWDTAGFTVPWKCLVSPMRQPMKPPHAISVKRSGGGTHGSGGSVRHSEKSLCLCSRSRGPVLDQLSTGHNADFGTFCDRLQKEHGDDFRFDPLSGRT